MWVPFWYFIPEEIHMKRYSKSWTPPRSVTFMPQRNLIEGRSEWFYSVPQSSHESLSQLKGTKKKKKHPQFWDTKTEDRTIFSRDWETVPSTIAIEAGRKARNLQTEESGQQSTKQNAPHPVKSKNEQPKMK